MRRLLVLLCVLTLPLVACRKPDVPTILNWAADGIDADCALGTGALAADICTFGIDSLTVAMAAYDRNPETGAAAVRKILIDAQTRQPALKPYLDWILALKF